MKFNHTTTTTLKKIIDELAYIALDYEWGSDEYEFLMEIAITIEDEVRKWRLKMKQKKT